MKFFPIISAICISIVILVSAVLVKQSVDGLAEAVRNQNINSGSGMPQRVEVSGLNHMGVDIVSLPHLPTIKVESVPPKIIPANQNNSNSFL